MSGGLLLAPSSAAASSSPPGLRRLLLAPRAPPPPPRPRALPPLPPHPRTGQLTREELLPAAPPVNFAAPPPVPAGQTSTTAGQPSAAATTRPAPTIPAVHILFFLCHRRGPGYLRLPVILHGSAAFPRGRQRRRISRLPSRGRPGPSHLRPPRTSSAPRHHDTDTPSPSLLHPRRRSSSPSPCPAADLVHPSLAVWRFSLPAAVRRISGSPARADSN
nr:vegetative cell wall protein gp1-like [Lolium perenne]